jgi:hypothetical protein
MAQRISKAEMTEKNPLTWVEGSRKAKKARKNVADQIATLIEVADLTGSQDLVSRRVREYADALRAGDPADQRAALMELAVAAGSTAAAIDLTHPPLAIV